MKNQQVNQSQDLSLSTGKVSKDNTLDASQTLYQRLAKVVKPEDIANHYSDLYVRYTPEAAQVIEAYKKDKQLSGWGMCSFFINQVEGGRWIDIPLAFDPYWESKLNN